MSCVTNSTITFDIDDRDWNKALISQKAIVENVVSIKMFIREKTSF